MKVCKGFDRQRADLVFGRPCAGMGGIIMYRSILNFKDTQVAIKQVKDYFQKN